jgi:hypothetical protein
MVDDDLSPVISFKLFGGSASLKQYHDSLLSLGALLQSDFGEILRFALEMLQTYRQDREDRL